MSVVVALKSGDRVYVGTDSQVTYGWRLATTLSNKNNWKIFRPEKDPDVIVGVTGALRDRDLLYCMEEFTDELARLKDEVNYKHIVTKVIPKILKLMQDNKRIESRNDNDTPSGTQPAADQIDGQYMSSRIILTYKNDIYKISQDLCCIVIDGFCAIGCGEELAMGYLNGATELIQNNPKQAVINAIKSACKSDSFVDYPIVIMTSDGEEEIITE
jgi:ATP-dependent protease HslVU (ClpYQ) peptidase subunit